MSKKSLSQNAQLHCKFYHFFNEIFKFIISMSHLSLLVNFMLSKFNLVGLTAFSHYSQHVSESNYDI